MEILQGYKKEHPLYNKIILKVMTSDKIKPVDALDKAILDIIGQIDKIYKNYEEQIKAKGKNL